MVLEKQSGWARGELWWEAFSRDFEINDLGFLRRNGYYEPWLWVQARQDEPWGPLRRSSVSVDRWGRWNLDEVALANGLGLGAWSQFRNYWEVYGSYRHHYRVRDDRDTRGGPLIVRPASNGFELSIRSDKRGALQGGGWFDWGSDTAGSTWRSLGSYLIVRLASNVELRFSPDIRWNVDDAQWLENVDTDSDGAVDHYVYGELKSKTVDLTTRLNLLFTRNLSLEFYMQPFVTVGDYHNFKELAQPDSYQFVAYPAPADNPDFRRRSLLSNMVLR